MLTQEQRVRQLETDVQEHSSALATMTLSCDRLDRQFERLEERMSRQFIWLVGIQITTLVAVVAALVSRG
jgi:hypothetical protein